MADTSQKMDANPKEDVLPHESQTLNLRKSEHKQDHLVSAKVYEETVISTVLDACGKTKEESTDSGRKFIGSSQGSSRTSVDSLNYRGGELDELSFDSDISIKNKHLVGLIEQSKRRPSSLSSLCDRINLLHLEDDSFENNTQGNIIGDELITNGKHEDLEEYFPASTIKSEESSGEFLPAVSTIKFDESCVNTEETVVNKSCEESEQLIPADSKKSLTKDSPIETGLERSLHSDKTNELYSEKKTSTADVQKDHSANVCNINKVGAIKITNSDNQLSSAKELCEGETVNTTENIYSVSIPSDSVPKLNETIVIDKSEDELLNIQTENITGKTSPGLSIKLNSINTSLKNTAGVTDELPFIEISNENYIKQSDSTKTPESSPAKLLEISVNASPNELDKTTSCINEDDPSFNDSCNAASTASSGGEIDNHDSTFVADSDSNVSFTVSNNTTTKKIDTQCMNTTYNNSNSGSESTGTSKATVSECIITEDTQGSPKEPAVTEITNREDKDTQIITVSPSTSTEISGLVGISQSTDTKDLTKSPQIISVSQSTNTDNISEFSNVVSVSQSTNSDDNLNSEPKDITFGLDTNSNFKMSDMVEKLNQQQAEISDLKLKLNAAQQHNASLELQIRQNEEIVIKAQAEALRTEQNYQQEVKQLKQKINENSKIIEKDRIRELEEQLKESKAKEAKLLAELSQKTKDDVNYQKIMDQYEITLKSRVSETKKLQDENETIRTHLTNLELAFSDVHSKYEKTKASLQGVKANEESLLQDLELAQSTNIQHEERYESLKAHARTQIEKSNKEIHDLKEQHELEISKLRAFVRRLEIKVSSLEVSLQQKTAECEQLSALCDEVTGKKV